MRVKNILYQGIIWRGLFYLTVFLLNILIARHYGAVVSGSVYYIINIYSLILLFTGFGLESGITFFTAKGEIDPGKLLGFSVVWALVMGLVTLTAFYFFISGI